MGPPGGVSGPAGLPPVHRHRGRVSATGEAYLEDLLERMEQAEHFIFMEYYIMAEGQLWDRLMDIFRRKAGQGVEIKVLFDDFGSMMRMPEEAVEELRRIGAEVLIFNPVHHYATGCTSTIGTTGRSPASTGTPPIPAGPILPTNTPT